MQQNTDELIKYNFLIGSPGKPQRPQLQVYDNGEQLVKVFWIEGHKGDYPTYGYIIESKTNG